MKATPELCSEVVYAGVRDLGSDWRVGHRTRPNKKDPPPTWATGLGMLECIRFGLLRQVGATVRGLRWLP